MSVGDNFKVKENDQYLRRKMTGNPMKGSQPSRNNLNHFWGKLLLTA
jgi:hypothetical protein